MPASPSPSCKLCGHATAERLRVPADRHPHQPRPVGEPVPYYACGGCGFLFSTHLDGPDAEAPYDENYFETFDHGATPRAELPLRLVRQACGWLNQAPGRVLDFGSGTGRAVAAMREAGLAAFGVDRIAPDAAHAHITVGPLDADAVFDTVTAVEVFEHLNDPVPTLEAIARALRPGGLLAFTTAIHEPTRLTADWWYLAPGAGHVSLYTAEALARLAARTGFTVLLTTPTNHLWVRGPISPLQARLLRARVLAGRALGKLGRLGGAAST